MRNLTLRYGVTQFTYWAASSGAMAFATTYLLTKNVPAGTVGLVLALAGLLSCLTQPLLAGIAMAAAGTLILFCTVQKPEKSTKEARDADPAAAP